jgi:hypothetical protein
MLPSTGALSVEEDREVIHHIEQDMGDICVRMAILEQKLRLKPTHAWASTYIYVPYLVSAFVDEGLALRLRELHLDGNLISEECEAVLNAGH